MMSWESCFALLYFRENRFELSFLVIGRCRFWISLKGQGVPHFLAGNFATDNENMVLCLSISLFVTWSFCGQIPKSAIRVEPSWVKPSEVESSCVELSWVKLSRALMILSMSIQTKQNLTFCHKGVVVCNICVCIYLHQQQDFTGSSSSNFSSSRWL